MAFSRKLRGPSTGFDPRSIAGLVGWWDASDLSTLSQTDDGNTPVSADAHPVGFVRNKAGGNAITQATSGLRPTYRTGVHPTRPVIRFTSASATQLLATVALGGGNQTWILVANNNTGTVNGYMMCAPGTTAGPAFQGTSTTQIDWQAGAGNARMPFVSGPSAFHVLSATMLSDRHTCRRNAAEQMVRTATISLSGVTQVSFGTNGTTAASFDMCEALCFSRVLSESELQAVERWLGAKWGITCPVVPTATHPEVQNWLNRVYVQGGTASTSTISALSTFCSTLDSSGVRSLLRRVNMFCGDSVTAASVPLLRSDSATGSQNGNIVDNMVNITNSHYMESSGIQGDGVLRWIGTGVTLNAATNIFYGVVLNANATASASAGFNQSGGCYAFGARGDTGNQSTFGLWWNPTNAGNLTAINFDDAGTSNSAVGNFTPPAGRLIIVSRGQNPSGLVVYSNGTSTGTPATSYASTVASPIILFGIRRFSGPNPTNLGDARISNYCFGAVTLTGAQATAISNAFTTLNQSLGRP
jgi:hypothetical protein